MKRSKIISFFAGAAAMIAVASLPACQGINTVNDPEFVEGADRFVNQTVGPEYEAYVMQDPALGTPGLTTPMRQDRINNVQSFRDTVAQAQAELAETTPTDQ